MMPAKFYHDQPRCYGNEIWDNIYNNSACIRDISYMFASYRGFSGSGYRMVSVLYYNDWPGCHGNEIWDKIGYNSAQKDRGVLGVRLLNDAR